MPHEISATWHGLPAASKRHRPCPLVKGEKKPIATICYLFLDACKLGSGDRLTKNLGLLNGKSKPFCGSRRPRVRMMLEPVKRESVNSAVALFRMASTSTWLYITSALSAYCGALAVKLSFTACDTQNTFVVARQIGQRIMKPFHAIVMQPCRAFPGTQTSADRRGDSAVSHEVHDQVKFLIGNVRNATHSRVPQPIMPFRTGESEDFAPQTACSAFHRRKAGKIIQRPRTRSVRGKIKRRILVVVATPEV